MAKMGEENTAEICPKNCGLMKKMPTPWQDGWEEVLRRSTVCGDRSCTERFLSIFGPKALVITFIVAYVLKYGLVELWLVFRYLNSVSAHLSPGAMLQAYRILVRADHNALSYSTEMPMVPSLKAQKSYEEQYEMMQRPKFNADDLAPPRDSDVSHHQVPIASGDRKKSR
jgi:hypothetical protein